ncbi:MAG TPA: ATPase, partial [Caulobacteraceae bacterium]|nr:ATPase [Caulobacteraceae bacterium]
LSLVRATGIIHTPQPAEALARVEALALALDDFALGGVAWATPLFGSAILALALQRGRLSGETAFDLSRLDEAFQEERWGVDAEAAERTANLRRDALALDAWFGAL